MVLLRILAIASVFAAGFCNEDSTDLSELTFSEGVSKKIMKMQWSVFGTSDRTVKPSIYRNVLTPVELETPMGSVRGIITETSKFGMPYGAFFGMPYAKPPIGDLRFAAPVPAEPWEGVYDGTYERASCFQFEGASNYESEDCLYINVYTPNYELKSDPLAVMVFIYGGAFIAGSSNSSIYAPDFIIENDVVLVTFNYRLGVLGFLSLQNEEVPGNAGLKDQALALKWVKDNIASFGGDPNRVTIFGESAGSASVNYHILSPSSKGLFDGAIMESGVATAPWAFIPAKDTGRLATGLARKVACNKFTAEEVLSCLRKVPAAKLTQLQQGALTIEDVLRLRPFAFVPTQEPNVEGAFLTAEPHKLLHDFNFNSVPTIIGSNTREGLIVLPILKSMDPFGLGVAIVGLDLSLFFPYQLRETKSFWQKRAIHKKIKKFYFGSDPVTLFSRGKLINLITDTAFTMPIQETAALLAGSSDSVYNYMFSFNGRYGFYKSKLNLEKESGVCHGDELGYLFYDEELHPPYSKNLNETLAGDAEKIVTILTKMWTDFAKTGDPTPETTDVITTKWSSRTLKNLVYLDIGNTLQLRDDLDKELKSRLDFWYDLVK